MDIVAGSAPQLVARGLFASTCVELLDMARGPQRGTVGVVCDEVGYKVGEAIARAVLGKCAALLLDSGGPHQVTLPADVIPALRVETCGHDHRPGRSHVIRTGAMTAFTRNSTLSKRLFRVSIYRVVDVVQPACVAEKATRIHRAIPCHDWVLLVSRRSIPAPSLRVPGDRSLIKIAIS
jgi:hypothetical protein